MLFYDNDGFFDIGKKRYELTIEKTVIQPDDGAPSSCVTKPIL